MPGALLVLNAGSSSLKWATFAEGDPPRRILWGRLEELSSRPRFVAWDDSGVVAQRAWPDGSDLGHAGAIQYLLTWVRHGTLAALPIAAVGHRVVHGGVHFSAPVVVDAAVLRALDGLVPLAPLHQPHNLAAIRAVREQLPGVPQVACFDTAFHRGQPHVAQEFGLPRRYWDEGIRRYGFHGLSYEYVHASLAARAPDAAAGRTIVAHLGNGASLCAMAGGRSVATTMSFTALDGLLMGTRCGAIDPGVLLHLMQRDGLDARGLEQLLYTQSGLLGVSGHSSDMRDLLASAESACAEAVDLFVYRITRELGSLAAALGGLDALVFTGGIGENTPAVRARVCRDAAWLGVTLDAAANDGGALCISAPDSRATAWVLPTNEELMIAIHTRTLVGSQKGEPCALPSDPTTPASI
ncbi:MAG: acetate/propionate family kinase [Polyangia bacterium]